MVFGEVSSDGVAGLKDVNTREFLMLGALAFVVLLFGHVWSIGIRTSISGRCHELVSEQVGSVLGRGGL